MSAAGDRQDPSRAALMALLRVLPDQPAMLDAVFAERRHWNAPEWARVVQAASDHGVLGVVFSTIASRVVLPPDAVETAERRIAVDDLWQAHLRRTLLDAVNALAAAGVDVCPLKGPLLWERVYPPGTIRHSLDVDLLVRARDFERAGTALEAVGYIPERGEAAAYLQQYGHHLSFAKPGAAPLELHFHAYAGFGIVLPDRFLLDRARPYSVAGCAHGVVIPSAEDEFVYLAVHAAGHSFVRLVWLYDMKLLLLASPRIDWNEVAVRARAQGVLSPVVYSLHLLDRWLGVTARLPNVLRRRSSRSRVADWLLGEVSRPQATSMRDNIGGLMFTSLLCDRPVTGAWLFQHHVRRSARRKLHALVPSLLPARWSS